MSLEKQFERTLESLALALPKAAHVSLMARWREYLAEKSATVESDEKGHKPKAYRDMTACKECGMILPAKSACKGPRHIVLHKADAFAVDARAQDDFCVNCRGNGCDCCGKTGLDYAPETWPKTQAEKKGGS